MRFTLLYCTETSWSSEIFSEIRSRKKRRGQKKTSRKTFFSRKIGTKMQGGTFLGFAALKVSGVLYRKNPRKREKKSLLYIIVFLPYTYST